MLRRLVALALCTVCILLYDQSALRAQGYEGDLPCVIEDGVNCTAWSSETTYTLGLGQPDCIAQVKYKTRICNGVFEIVITDVDVLDGCGNWDEMSLFHYTRTGFKEYLILGLMSDIFASAAPDCPASMTRAQVYTAACGIWACCEYILPNPPEFTCEPEWGNDPPPHYGVMPKKVKACKWKACGQTCCRRVYVLCKNELGYLDIKLISKTQLGECSGQDVPVQFSKPCEDGC